MQNWLVFGRVLVSKRSICKGFCGDCVTVLPLHTQEQVRKCLAQEIKFIVLEFAYLNKTKGKKVSMSYKRNFRVPKLRYKNEHIVIVRAMKVD